MAVKLELYRVFKEVAETGNISLAAKNLYISQSAVSQSIKQLETALQARLFARSPRGVSLTWEGQMLYQYVRSALGLLATGEDKLSQAQQLLLGTLTIGASDTVTSFFLTPYLEAFHRQHPGNGRPLPHPAGELAGIMLLKPGQTHGLHEGPGLLPPLGLGDPPQLHGQGHVVHNGPPGQQGVALGDISHGGQHALHRLTGQQHLSLVHGHLPGQHIQGSGLAAAGRTDQGHQLPLRHRQGHSFQRPHRRPLLGHREGHGNIL